MSLRGSLCSIPVNDYFQKKKVLTFDTTPGTEGVCIDRFFIWSSGGPPVQWSGTFMQLWKSANVKLF